MECYAAFNKNEDIRMKSSSGGLFSLFASEVINNSGVVYGVRMSEDNYSTVYDRASNEQELEALRGSKYLQAKIHDTYIKVKNDLDNGIYVLFTGTGCQINGLKNFLRKDYDNLICVDVICHGTPSPKLWKEYLVYQENKLGGDKITDVKFRNKDCGWENYRMKQDDTYIPMSDDIFMQLFLRNFALRPSCYNCAAKKNKCSDITLGDFWGIDDVSPEMNDHKGTSLVIVRSQKGQEFLDSVKDDLVIKSVTYEDGVRCNPSEHLSTDYPQERSTFFDDLDSLGFEALYKKYLQLTLKGKIRRFAGKVKNKVLG